MTIWQASNSRENGSTRVVAETDGLTQAPASLALLGRRRIDNAKHQGDDLMEINKAKPGNFCWFELATSDQAAAKKFYGGLFGWTANDSPMGPDAFYTMFQHRGKNVGAAYALMPDQDGVPPHWGTYVAVANVDEVFGWKTKVTEGGGFPYTHWQNDGADIGGMLAIMEQMGRMPPCWVNYVQVANCDETAAKATSLGGKVCMPPMDIPNTGRFAMLQDPQAALLSVIALAAMHKG
jgi:predicted enzyme related to lactoylglutathione lyase